MRLLAFALLSAVAVLGAACTNDPGPSNSFHSTDGQVLTSMEGRTLYVYELDSEWGNGGSYCNGVCSETFQPYLVTDDNLARARSRYGWASSIRGKGEDPEPQNAIWGWIRRDDGTRQWTYYGRPLYTYRLDLVTGDRRGDQLWGVWKVSRPRP